MVFRGKFLSQIPLNADLRASVDHVQPRFLKGRSVMENLRLAHRFCNMYRHYHPVTTAMGKNFRSELVRRHGQIVAELLIHAALERQKGSSCQR